MNSITLGSTNFSKQLGIYDFFNIIIAGAVFIFSLCVVNSSIYSCIWSNMNFVKGLGIVILIYIVGLILQELGSWADEKKFKIYERMSRSIIKNTNKSGEELKNDIVNNKLLIKQYRKYADLVLDDLVDKSNSERFNDDSVNGFFFSVCQYYVAVNGKDKKVEKMRALFAMSQTLTMCFAALSLSTLVVFQPCNILGIWLDAIYGRIITAIVFAVVAVIFYGRTKKIMSRFLLILLGTYDAILRLENTSNKIV